MRVWAAYTAASLRRFAATHSALHHWANSLRARVLAAWSGWAAGRRWDRGLLIAAMQWRHERLAELGAVWPEEGLGVGDGDPSLRVGTRLV